MSKKQTTRNERLPTSDELDAANTSLVIWGVLTRLECGESLGVLSNNALNTLSKLGVKVTSTHIENIRWPRHATQTDKLINQLSHIKPKWAKALTWQYSEFGNLRQKAHAHNIAKSTFHEQVQKGRHWIAQNLRQSH